MAPISSSLCFSIYITSMLCSAYKSHRVKSDRKIKHMENNLFVLIPRFYAFSSCVVSILSACTICLNSSIDHNAEYFSSSPRFIISIHFNFCFLYSFTLIPYFTNYPTIILSTLLVLTNWGFTTKIYFLTLWNINYSNRVLK